MKLIKDIDVSNKRVLVRVDFNVSLDGQGGIIDDFKIRATLPTIDYLFKQKAKIILMSHLGKPGGKVDHKYSLRSVGERLSGYLNLPVQFAADCLGLETKNKVKDLSEGQLLLLENLRFYPGEEANDISFAKELADLGEMYVNDAFAECHRDYASMTTITKFLPAFGGLLLEKEIDSLSRVKNNPDHPLTVIIGGAKISTKIKLIKSFLNKAENIILGGALANTVLHAKGIAVGKSLIEEAMTSEIGKLEITDTKIHLPLDAIVCVSKDDLKSCHAGPIGIIQERETILDIGPDSEKLFDQIIRSSKMIFWNGPMGLFESDFFSRGSLAIARAIVDSGVYSVIGGGETVAFLERHGLIDKFSFVSTGGGAMLEFLSGEPMPGIEALK